MWKNIRRTNKGHVTHYPSSEREKPDSSIIGQSSILGRLHVILPIGFLDRPLVPILCHCPHYSEVEFSENMVPGRWNNPLEQAEQVITCEESSAVCSDW